MARSHRSSSSGGRSHSSGGGSSFRSSSSHSRHRGGMHIHVGSRHYGGSTVAGQIGIFIFLLFFFGMFIFASVLMNTQMHEDLEEIEHSYNQYQQMISYAEENPDYQETAYVLNKEYSPDYKLWAIEYVVYYSSNYQYPIHQDSTFYMYTDEQASQIRKGDPIIIAIDTPDIQSNTNSINMDYKNIALENDCEYKEVKDELFVPIIMLAIFGVIEGIIVIAFVKSIIKAIKNKGKDNTQETTIATSQPQQQATTVNEPKYCQYCGSRLEDNNNQCNICGANNRF